MPRASAKAASGNLVIGSYGSEQDQADLYKLVAEREGHEIGWEPIKCAGYDVDAEGKRHYHHLERIPCDCDYGYQEIALVSTANEILLCGGRGSGKSDTTFGFILKGNPEEWWVGSDIDYSYTYSGDYTFLVVRKNSTDLDDWIWRFKKLAEPMGARFTENPMRVRFPSGAIGYFGHLDDEASIQKYMGKQFVRIVVEEAGHIPSEKLYQNGLVASNRTTTRGLHPQILLTANPGGPAQRWLNARFRYPHGGVEPWPDRKIYHCPLTGRSYHSIWSNVMDNPYFLANANQDYIKTLESYKYRDPLQYRLWYLGDMDATEGQFFGSFRKIQRPGEPPNACHVITVQKNPDGTIAHPPLDLAPWWPRAMGVDWGFGHNTAAVWGCWTPRQQLHVYRELVLNNVGTIELGGRLALAALPDLERMTDPHMSLYLSHDAFHRDDFANTEAEQIQIGIQQVLGKDGVFVYAPTLDEEDGGTVEEIRSKVERRRKETAKRAAITIIPAGGPWKRRPAANRLREYLRWWTITEGMNDEEEARKILKAHGALAYSEHLQRIEAERNRTLPVLQIWDNCPRIIKGVEAAQADTKDVEALRKMEGDDEVDALLHLVGNFSESEGDKPRDVWIAERVQRSLQTNANIQAKVMANILAEAEWSKTHVARVVARSNKFGGRRSRGGSFVM
jgi:hypothetical protein